MPQGIPCNDSTRLGLPLAAELRVPALMIQYEELLLRQSLQNLLYQFTRNS